MAAKAYLILGNDQKENTVARKLVRKILGSNFKCASDFVLQDCFQTPFLQMPNGARYFGLEAIRRFASA